MLLDVDLNTFKLRTTLHKRPMYVPVAIRNSTRRADKRKGFVLPMLVGSIEVDEWTTLEEARWIISRELDRVRSVRVVGPACAPLTVAQPRAGVLAPSVPV